MIELRPFNNSAPTTLAESQASLLVRHHYDPSIWPRQPSRLERRRDRAQHRLSAIPFQHGIITYVREGAITHQDSPQQGLPNRDVQ